MSHGGGKLTLAESVTGPSELFTIYSINDNTVTIRCLGDESDMYLSHAHAKIGLQPKPGPGENFTLERNDQIPDLYKLKGTSMEQGMIWAHYDGKIKLLMQNYKKSSNLFWKMVLQQEK